MVADAWRHYRGAVFCLRTGNATVAGFGLEQMRSRWQLPRDRFSGAAPDAYSDDSRFAATLEAIGARATADLVDALDRGDATAAVNVLRELRSFDRMLFPGFGRRRPGPGCPPQPTRPSAGKVSSSQ